MGRVDRLAFHSVDAVLSIFGPTPELARKVSTRLGVSPAAVSRAVRRGETLVRTDPTQVARIVRGLEQSSR